MGGFPNHGGRFTLLAKPAVLWDIIGVVREPATDGPLPQFPLFAHTMFITNNRTLNALDALFNAAELIAHYDYVAVGRTIINKAIIAAAIIIGVTTYIITAVQLWWDDYGTIIITNGTRFVINLVDYSHELFVFGRETRRFVNNITNRLADSAFFAITA